MPLPVPGTPVPEDVGAEEVLEVEVEDEVVRVDEVVREVDEVKLVVVLRLVVRVVVVEAMPGMH